MMTTSSGFIIRNTPEKLTVSILQMCSFIGRVCVVVANWIVMSHLLFLCIPRFPACWPQCVRCSLASVTYKKETIWEVSPGTVAQWVFACLTSASVCALLPEKSGVVLRRYIFYLASLAPPHYAMEKEYTLSRMALRWNWTIMPLMWAFCRGMKISLDKWARENKLAYLRGEV